MTIQFLVWSVNCQKMSRNFDNCSPKQNQMFANVDEKNPQNQHSAFMDNRIHCRILTVERLNLQGFGLF